MRYLLIFIQICYLSVFAQKKTIGDTITFAQITDTHIDNVSLSRNSDALKKSILEINNLNVNFTVISGDLINAMNLMEYKTLFEILDQFDSSFYLVPGNHDVGMIPNNKSLAAYRKIVGDDYYTFKYKENLFVVINTQLLISEVPNETSAQYDWLIETFKHKKEKCVIAFGHMPLFINSDQEEDIPNNNLSKSYRLKLIEMFKSNDVIAMLTGHLHRLNIQKYSNIEFIACEPLAVENNNSPSGFRIFKLADGKLSSNFFSVK